MSCFPSFQRHSCYTSLIQSGIILFPKTRVLLQASLPVKFQHTWAPLFQPNWPWVQLEWSLRPARRVNVLQHLKQCDRIAGPAPRLLPVEWGGLYYWTPKTQHIQPKNSSIDQEPRGSYLSEVWSKIRKIRLSTTRCIDSRKQIRSRDSYCQWKYGYI